MIETGCDGATLCFFDPAALPDNFDAQIEADPVDLMENLQQQQRLWFGGTGGDGGYIFHVYVDEDLPASLHTKVNHLDSFDAFVVPSGRLCICGAEYAANDPMKGSPFTPEGGLSNYSQMGDMIELDVGVYSIVVFATDYEWSEQQREAVEKSIIPKKLLLRHRCLELLMALCFVVGGIVLFISGIMTIAIFLIALYNYFFQPHLLSRLTTVLQIWLPMILGSGFSFALGGLLSRCYNRSNITQALQTVAKEIPDYVLLVAKQDRKSKELALQQREIALLEQKIADQQKIIHFLENKPT